MKFTVAPTYLLYVLLVISQECIDPCDKLTN